MANDRYSLGVRLIHLVLGAAVTAPGDPVTTTRTKSKGFAPPSDRGGLHTWYPSLAAMDHWT